MLKVLYKKQILLPCLKLKVRYRERANINICKSYKNNFYIFFVQYLTSLQHSKTLFCLISDVFTTFKNIFLCNIWRLYNIQKHYFVSVLLLPNCSILPALQFFMRVWDLIHWLSVPPPSNPLFYLFFVLKGGS